MLQDYKVYNVRDAAVLTGDYVAGTVIEDVEDQNQLIILVDLDINQATDARLKVETTTNNDVDSIDWYQDSSVSTSSGVSTVNQEYYKFTASGKYRIPLAIKDKHIRISVTGTGTLTETSMAVKAVIGVA